MLFLQLDFSDPILSYFSALRFILDGLFMLKYGYEKVSTFVFIMFPLFRADAAIYSSDRTRFVQDCHTSEVDGASFES